MRSLSSPEAATAHPKAGRLARLLRAGLPVPAGLILERDEWNPDGEIQRAIVQLLEAGPVVVRTVLADEDAAGGSAAGLGTSVSGCRSIEDVRTALQTLATAAADPAIALYRQQLGTTMPEPPQALVQHQVTRASLLVLAIFDDGSAYTEVHTGQGDALATGASPAWSGPLADWPDPAAGAVASLCARLAREEDTGAHGLDAEVVVDPHGQVHLVQARPIAAALHRGWEAFLAEVHARGQADLLGGLQVLDVEHNPRPLSPAHASVLDHLREQRPGAGDPVALAGWLYARQLPRDLARPSAGATPSAVDTIRRLHEVLVPDATAALHALTSDLRAATLATLPVALDRALELFLSMIDAYVRELVPARTAARRTAGLTADTETPFSLRGRGEILGVLPVIWDVASPTLADAEAMPALPGPGPLPTDEAGAATLLGEWDDHLFSLGLAPIRATYVRAAELLGLGENVFLLALDELRRAATGDPAPWLDRLLGQRRDEARRAGALNPPLRIFRGHPLPPAPGRPLHGMPIGPAFEGRVAVYADLDALVAGPAVDPETIVILPALTTQAAVVLHARGVRAVCCEHGGAMSHAALAARELRLSALIGCRDCTLLTTGTRARIDTRLGRLVLLPS